MKRNKYSAGAVKFSFWFMEFRKEVQLLAQGKTFEEIKKAKLIYEKRIGFNPAMRIYIGKMNHVAPRKITNHKKWDYEEKKWECEIPKFERK